MKSYPETKNEENEQNSREKHKNEQNKWLG